MLSCEYCEIFNNTYFETGDCFLFYEKEQTQLKTKQLKQKSFRSMEISGFSIL